MVGPEVVEIYGVVDGIGPGVPPPAFHTQSYAPALASVHKETCSEFSTHIGEKRSTILI